MPTLIPQPALRNRGVSAWSAVEGSSHASFWLSDRHPDVAPVVTRAQVHAVTDDTNVAYLRTVFRTLDAVEAGVRAGAWPAPRGIADLDIILSCIVDDFIYIQRLPASVGTKMHAAWAHVFSNHSDKLPNFSRSIAGWRRLAPAGERHGMSEPRWGAIVRELFATSRTALDRESALWVALQKDVYGREQDLELLRKTSSDYAVRQLPGGRIQIALFFGVRERGESV